VVVQRHRDSVFLHELLDARQRLVGVPITISGMPQLFAYSK